MVEKKLTKDELIKKMKQAEEVANRIPDKKIQQKTINGVVANDEKNTYDMTADEFKHLFGDSILTKAQQEMMLKDYGNGFRNEELEFKRYVVTPTTPNNLLSKDLQLSNIRESDVPVLSDALTFAKELKDIGAIKTSEWFSFFVYSFLNLKVSVNGFGRKELNTTRHEESAKTEPTSSGWLSKTKK